MDQIVVSAEGVRPNPLVLAKTLAALLEPIVHYSREVFDNGQQIIDNLLTPFPGEIADAVRTALLPQ
jgi:hypothetical protein